MATEISDLAASAFAARFYAAVASAQPIGPALRQGAVVLDLMGMDEGWKPNLLSRADVAVDDLILVQVRSSSGCQYVRSNQGSLPYAASAWRGGQPALGVV